MNIIITNKFERDYEQLPANIKNRTDKQLTIFVENPRQPSLRIKKIKGTNIWEGSITKKYRFTFFKEKNYVILRRVGTHDILKTP